MQRKKFKPLNHGDGPWPAVVIIGAALFQDPPLVGPKGQRQAIRDLTDAGFLVFTVNHRSAPPNTIDFQREHEQDSPENGRPPQQSNDIKQQILAARYDIDCDGTVFVIGASSGATHALWVALDPADTTDNGWGSDDFPQAVVSLSGGTDLSWRAAISPDQDEILVHFRDTVWRYTATCCADNPARLAYQKSVSPVSLVDDPSDIDPEDIPPMRLFTTEEDSMPFQQMDIMAEALLDHNFSNFMAFRIEDSSQHAFQYWHTPISGNNRPWVSDEVIAFFDANLP